MFVFGVAIDVLSAFLLFSGCYLCLCMGVVVGVVICVVVCVVIRVVIL